MKYRATILDLMSDGVVSVARCNIATVTMTTAVGER